MASCISVALLSGSWLPLAGSLATSTSPEYKRGHWIPAVFPTEEMGIELACPVMFHEILGQLFNDQ
jgi:hypothetical protein